MLYLLELVWFAWNRWIVSMRLHMEHAYHCFWCIFPQPCCTIVYIGKSDGRLESRLLSISHREFNMGHYNQRPEYQDYSGSSSDLTMLSKSPDPSNLPPQINRGCAYDTARFFYSVCLWIFCINPCAYPQASARYSSICLQSCNLAPA